MSDPAHDPELRASHEDREAVVKVLQTAAGEGRIEIDELHERLEAAWRARTYGDLDRLVTDLPGVRLPWQDSAGVAMVASSRAPDHRGGEPLTITAPMTNQRRDGAWDVPAWIVLEPSVATITLDFRRATCRHSRVRIDVHGGVGGVTLILPPGWMVDSSGLRTSWGTAKNKYVSPPAPGAPVLVVTGGIGMGSFRARGPRFYEK